MTTDERPLHSVSVGAAVVGEGSRLLAIRRRDTGAWQLPGGILERDEGPLQAVRREVLEETGVLVEPGPLTGVYKNMSLGVVSLVFRCHVIGGEPRPTEEATQVAWLTLEEIAHRMVEAFAIRLQDAVTAEPTPQVRLHDGTNLIV
ncbi:NUDIX domain-containing protein [Nonomuraea sp. NPDC026600]|uniref:NUDIX hydrolase n=1 Tax=Nonomuraea sp. NPDC026600 TaxID=3155363 RepID=UPI0033D06DD5